MNVILNYGYLNLNPSSSLFKDLCWYWPVVTECISKHLFPDGLMHCSLAIAVTACINHALTKPNQEWCWQLGEHLTGKERACEQPAVGRNPLASLGNPDSSSAYIHWPFYVFDQGTWLLTALGRLEQWDSCDGFRIRVLNEEEMSTGYQPTMSM